MPWDDVSARFWRSGCAELCKLRWQHGLLSSLVARFIASRLGELTLVCSLREATGVMRRQQAVLKLHADTPSVDKLMPFNVFCVIKVRE